MTYKTGLRKAGAALARGRELLAAGRWQQAAAYLQPMRAAFPQHPGIALLLADALHTGGKLPDAAAAYHAALALDAANPEAWFSLGCARLAEKAYGAAYEALTRAASLAPETAPVRYNLAKSQFQLGEIEAAIENFGRAAWLDPAMAQMARASIATIIAGSPAADNEAVLRARAAWATAEARNLTPITIRNDPTAERKLRIGYMSAFFGDRNWIKPVMAMLNHHDRAAFEIHMFSDGKPPEPASGYRDHDADFVHDLRFVENDQAADILGDIGLDVVVDLNGYSFPKRLALMMRRPARRVVGWVNMFATTGIPQFDWIVGDHTVLPEAEARFYAEPIHRLPGTYMAFEILYPVPNVTPPPCLENGHVTFGCLGSHYKLTGGMLVAFACILRAAPSARLFIKNGALEEPSTRAHFQARLQAAGIDASRVTLAGRSEHFAFLQAYENVDIALDTFPYNGGTTTTEALWQGVPVLTFDGDRWASRTSKSLLFAAGLQDWVMPDAAQYEARAIQLANAHDTPARLTTMRATLRDTLRTSAACDVAGMCASLEEFYRQICDGA